MPARPLLGCSSCRIISRSRAFGRGGSGEMFRTVGALLILGWSFTTLAHAQPNMLTLACKGTTTEILASPLASDPISMGIIVNFTTRTVQGFGSPGWDDFPVKITAANDVTIVF